MWDHGISTKEEIVKLREKESKNYKDKGRKGFKSMIPEEIAIIKLHFSSIKYTRFKCDGYKHGYIDSSEVKWYMNEDLTEEWKKHLKEERIAYTVCGDQIKFNNQNEIEWIFSPRY
jgi:hypothetical protein